MRIIAGTAGRIAIKVPHEVTRPTTDFVRQAMFSILGDSVVDAQCVDLFAGSGALGLEALSRGAASCIFVDASRHAIKTIEQNLLSTKLSSARAACVDVETWLKRDAGSYDLIFADPPYAKLPSDTEHIAKLFHSGHLLPRLRPTGLLYTEISKATASPTHPAWNLIDRRHYGSSAILLYRPNHEK